MKKTWVQDTNKGEVRKAISEINVRTGTPNPPGSRYVPGPSKSGNCDEVGIYFKDPTAH